MLTIVVIAKECVPGRVKTRLTPALSPEQAAAVAFASLTDTLQVVNELADALPHTRRILAFDGNPDNAPAQAAAFEIVQQACGGLDTRLAAIFDRCEGPTLLVGMDTPQLTAADLRAALEGLTAAGRFGSRGTDAGPDSDSHPGSNAGPGTDADDRDLPARAWLGPANDGGFWALGMTHPDGSLIRGVEMSRDDTGARQYERLIDAGLQVTLLPELVDVDTFADAVTVAALAQRSRFARAFAAAVATPSPASSSALTGVTSHGRAPAPHFSVPTALPGPVPRGGASSPARPTFADARQTSTSAARS